MHRQNIQTSQIIFSGVPLSVLSGECQCTCSLEKYIQIIPTDRHTSFQGSQPSACTKVLPQFAVLQNNGSIEKDRVSKSRFVIRSPVQAFFLLASSSEPLIHIEDAYIGILRHRHCPEIQMIDHSDFLILQHFGV